MLSKSDCLSILVQLEDQGINIDAQMKKLIVAKDLPLDVLQFIAANRGIEVINFYEMLRKKHNQKKSPLYINILNGQIEINEVLTTLICLLTQVILYGNKLETNRDEFFKQVRAEEISRVINEYFKEGIADNCINLLRLIKTDLLVLEGISGRRDFQ